jgi:hypothetical protein
MRNVTSFTRSALALQLVGALSACAVRTPREPTADGFASVVDSVATNLVELELRRVSLLATTAADSTRMRTIDAQMSMLRQRVHALTNHASAERVVRERLIVALDAQASSVSTRLNELRLAYTDTYPTVRQAAQEQRLLQERKAEILSGM